MQLYLFVLITMNCIRNGENFNGKMVGSIVSAVRLHYHASYVVFLHNDDQEMKADMKDIVHSQELQSSTLHANELTKTFDHTQFHSDKLLYVAYKMDKQVQEAIGEVIHLHASHVKWLVFLNEEASMKKLTSNIKIPLDCEFLVAQSSPGELEVTLSEVYHVHPTMSVHVSRVAEWNSTSGLTWLDMKSVIQRRSNLMGLLMQAAVLPQSHALTVEEYKNGKPSKLSGFVIDIWEAMEHRMNFSTEYNTAPDGVYGVKDANGTWSGMIGMVSRKKVSVGIDTVTLLQSRMKVVKYLPPIWKEKVKVYIKRPSMKTQIPCVFSPFSSQVWIATLLCIVAIIMSLTTARKATYHYGDPDSVYNITTSCLCVLRSFCQQGNESTPKGWACRLIYFTSYATALVVFIPFSAKFISFLAVQSDYEVPFRTFKDLLDDGSYRLGVLRGSAVQDDFQGAREPVLREVYRKLIKPIENRLPKSNAAGIKTLCTAEKFAFCTTELTLQRYSDEIPCKVVDIPEAYYIATTSIIIGRASPYKKLINFNFGELRRNGILKRLKNRFPKMKKEETELETESVPIESVVEIYNILLFGYLLSVVILIIELLTCKCIRKKRH